MTGSDVAPGHSHVPIPKDLSHVTPPRIDLPTVSRLLHETLDVPVYAIAPLPSGAWSAAYSFETPNGPFVIRISDHPDDFNRDAYARRFQSVHLPIPSVTHHGRLNGHHVAISERVNGKFLDDLDDAGCRRTVPSLVCTLEALRTANLDGTTGYGGWGSDGNGTHNSWREHLRMSVQDSPDQRGGSWRHRLESSPIGAEAFDRGSAVFLRHVDHMPEFRHLLHGDMLNFNVFVDADRISGVIDWGCAMYGDFLYELAWFAFWWPWYPRWHDTDIVEHARAMFAEHGADLSSFRERMCVYELQIGLMHQAYHATTGDWAMLEAVMRRTATIADEIR